MPQVSHIEPGPDTFRILLTTDNHVGFMENDPIRGDDGWKTFSEIMHLAVEKDVDMVIQGGDLFHVNHPSKKAYYHVMNTLRECCWCDKPIEYQLLSDPSGAMATRNFGYPAEYDRNVNVGIPVYAISGNHDDSTGEELLSPLDLLSVAALINYFGRVTDNSHITVCPLVFNKGSTNVALYGLQSIREDRLKRTMAAGGLEFLQPDADDNVDWFNMMCVHQNHVPRPGIRVLDELSLPEFLDFILWGHEHECVPRAVQNASTGFSVLQAGSSIATSLSEGELAEKNVFLLSIKGKDFALESIPLKSVRPFAMRSVVLAETGLEATSANKKEVLNFLIGQVDELIAESVKSWKENNKEDIETLGLTDADVPLPLIRLRVEYSGGYEVENPRYFSNRFVGKVANVNDVLMLYRKNSATRDLIKKMQKEHDMMKEDGEEGLETGDGGESNIFGMIESQLDDTDLILIRKEEYSKTLGDIVSKEDKGALDEFIDAEEGKSVEMLKKMSLEDGEGGSLSEVKKSFRKLAKRIRAEAELGKSAVEDSKMDEVLGLAKDLESDEEEVGKKKKPAKKGRKPVEVIESDSEKDVEKRPARRGRPQKTAVEVIESESEEERPSRRNRNVSESESEFEESPKPKKTPRKTRARKPKAAEPKKTRGGRQSRLPPSLFDGL